MAIRTANAEWSGDLKGGKGSLGTESGALKNIAYNFQSRFEEGDKTNPEELIGAAHAACFSMALANSLAGAGYTVNSIKTEDKVHLEKQEQGFTITKIVVNTVADIEGIDENTFMEHAENMKKGCPVSRALGAINIELNAKLK